MIIFRNQEEKVAYLYIAPALIIIFMFIAYPFIYSIFLSLTNSTVGRPGNFVGFSNFRRLLRSEIFLRVLKNSFIYTFGAVVCKLIVGMLVALVIEKIRRGSIVIKGLILLPFVIPPVFVTLVWWWMFNPHFSVLNWIILHLGIIKNGVKWLSTPRMAMISVITVNTWIGIPFFAISILSGLVSINQELYDAADIDGANDIQKFRFITLPLLKTVVAVVLLFSTLMTIADFNIVYVLTGGGPMYGTHLFATLAFQEGIATGNLSRGAAISLFLLPVLVIASYLQLRIVRREVQR